LVKFSEEFKSFQKKNQFWRILSDDYETVERDWKLFSKSKIKEIFESTKKPFLEFIEKFKEMKFTVINNIEEESKDR
jgi:hypothetical protein